MSKTLPDGWESWEGQRIAFMLEDHLIPTTEYAAHNPPDWLQAMLDENMACEQPMPMGLGHHEETGYYVIGTAGQGPFICGVEKWGPPEPRAPRDDDPNEIRY